MYSFADSRAGIVNARRCVPLGRRIPDIDLINEQKLEVMHRGGILTAQPWRSVVFQHVKPIEVTGIANLTAFSLPFASP